jgi:hypothetical protein
MKVFEAIISMIHKNKKYKNVFLVRISFLHID